MRTQILKPPITAGVGALLTLPAAYFLLINLVSELGWPGPYEFSEPLLLALGLHDGMGLNINLLIAFGPLIALLLNLTSVIAFDWESTATNLKLNFHIEKKWTNWSVILSAGLCLLILFLYLIGENCK
jgi:hypothetical protein